MSNTIAARLDAIRTEMAKSNLDAFIIPRADEYLGEYVPEHNERMLWASGFTGSAGVIIVLKTRAAIFVDGRYTVQVRQQLDANLFEFLSLHDTAQAQWLIEQLGENAQVGFDARLHTLAWFNQTHSELAKAQIQLTQVEQNPIDLNWSDRPTPTSTPVMLFSEQSAGRSSLEKRKTIGLEINKQGADVAIISALDSFCWLLNIRGKDIPCLPVVLGTALLHANGDMQLFTDINKLPDDIHAHVGEGVSFKPEAELAAELATLEGTKVLASPESCNAWLQLTAQAAGAQLIAGNDPVALPKAQKNAAELAGMKACHIRDGVAVSRFLAWLDREVAANRLYDEAVLADKLESFRLSDPMYQEPSFDTISATGANAAMCHYNHNNGTPAQMQMNSIYLVDSGAQYLDGTTDVTRTIAIGDVTDEQRKMVTLVLKGHISIDQAKFPKGTSGMQLDSFARQYLWQHGFDFDHGTGHGVGHYLSVHEGPQGIAKGRSNVPLLDGMVLSNEPGYYRADQFGIRLENLIAVRPCEALANIEREMFEFEALTFIPMDARLIDKQYLTESEVNWFNQYHQQVKEKLSPFMQGDDLDWLNKVTAAI
ncbi:MULTISPECIES: aminopeptidase P family protein [unclassified Shewanella]|uniref:aminopeptidase P family protein n=1 Tax=unclassified Shewanella TaxID=196818 RepID=UPI001BC54C35|nr:MULTISPECIES: aminopeptidase P family protein [unclassified Shewanella]GIU12097.1 Xaa-Pro aminopeptidase [Shewanella sp. MBTL60-112-B1]GIU31712.1 Xaa-Pro aminopeptidase [Shewanella sp. MBTL60-112-B2]